MTTGYFPGYAQSGRRVYRGNVYDGSYNARMENLEEIRRLAYLLDEAFELPGTRYRFGYDVLLGFVPVIGDFSGFAVSSYIIYKAAEMGVPRRLVARMVFYAFMDALIGSIPILGNIFDFFFKVNKRNMQLIERHLAYAY